MAKQKHRTSKQKPKSILPGASPGTPLSAKVASESKAIGWREWLLRLLLIVLSPTLFVLLLELGLRLLGYGYPTTFFLKTEDGKGYTVNRKFAWQFYQRETATQPHPFLIPAEKAKGTLRIFILGESAAVGTPDPAFGFARILEVMLRRQYPTQRFEIINAAMRGINSHIILPIARECAAHQPDLFIVYMGNNEIIGCHAPEPTGFNLTPHLGLLRTLQWLKATRTGQWLAATMTKLRGSAGQKEMQDMEYFRKHRLAADDPKRKAVYDNFRANLDDICQFALNSGAKVIASTVAVNLKDFPPLASLHRADLSEPDKARWEATYAAGVAAENRGQLDQAMAHYLEAARLDDHFAELHFRLGRCFLASTNFAKAREHYTLARDWDALQFRTDSRMNAIIREISTDKPTPGLTLLEAEQAFADSPESDHRIPGEKLFYEHVHLRFAGDYRLALTVLPQVAVTLALGASAIPVPTRTECADELAFTGYDELNVTAAMVKLTANPPFRDQLEHDQRQQRLEQIIKTRQGNLRPPHLKGASELYRQALARNPYDWQLHHNFGSLLVDMKDYAGTVTHFEAALKLMPSFLPLRLALANALMETGKVDEAIRQYRETLRLDPDYLPAKESLANAENQRPTRFSLPAGQRPLPKSPQAP